MDAVLGDESHGDLATGFRLEQRAFERDLRPIRLSLLNYARRLARNEALAEDLVQDTVARAWAGRGGFAPGSSFKAWTFRILRNVFLDEVRRSKPKVDWSEAIENRTLVIPADQEFAILLEDLGRAMTTLSDDQRRALDLIGCKGLSYDEASVSTRLPVGTLKSQVKRARAALAAYVADGERRRSTPTRAPWIYHGFAGQDERRSTHSRPSGG